MSPAHALEIEDREAPANDPVPEGSALIAFVQERPWVAVMGAALAGYVLARLVRRLR